MWGQSTLLRNGCAPARLSLRTHPRHSWNPHSTFWFLWPAEHDYHKWLCILLQIYGSSNKTLSFPDDLRLVTVKWGASCRRTKIHNFQIGRKINKGLDDTTIHLFKSKIRRLKANGYGTFSPIMWLFFNLHLWGLFNTRSDFSVKYLYKKNNLWDVDWVWIAYEYHAAKKHPFVSDQGRFSPNFCTANEHII